MTIKCSSLAMSPVHLKKVKAILSGEVPGCGVLLYGPRAAGTAKPKAYLDLAIMSEKPLGREKMEKLGAAFAGAGLPFPVALVDWADTGSSFRKEIRRTAIQLEPCGGGKTR